MVDLMWRCVVSSRFFEEGQEMGAACAPFPVPRLLQRYKIALGFRRLVIVITAEPPKEGVQRYRIFKHCSLAFFHDCKCFVIQPSPAFRFTGASGIFPVPFGQRLFDVITAQ